MNFSAKYQGYGTDKQIWLYVCEHWEGWFLAIGSCKNFTKHCASLRDVKERILQKLIQPQASDGFYMVDGVARAHL